MAQLTHFLNMAIKKLKTEYPRLKIVDSHHGHFNRDEELKLIRDINLKGPTFLVVGMGSPKQEKWINENLKKINASVFWGVGALFDVISGRLPRAPLFMQKIGLEWLYRLFQEPKRLSKRYLYGNFKFLYFIYREWERGSNGQKRIKIRTDINDHAKEVFGKRQKTLRTVK